MTGSLDAPITLVNVGWHVFEGAYDNGENLGISSEFSTSLDNILFLSNDTTG